MVLCFKADFFFWGCCDVVLDGLLQHKGESNVTLFFLEMEVMLYDLASFGTLNSKTPRWTDAA